MSEITRYEVELSDNRCDCGGARGLNEVECANGDYVRHADHLIYLREMRMDRDVERLRADTAEAEVEKLLLDLDQMRDEKGDEICDAYNKLAAAEQRIAELQKNSDRYEWLRDKSESVHQFYLSTPIWFTGVKFKKENVDSTIDAALNPNPEAESHE